jgi:hypothetical protein
VSCPHCGAETGSGQKFCSDCGARLDETTARSTTQALDRGGPAGGTTGAMRLNPALLAVAGFLIGALVGFQMRPAVMFVGQLPFETVITRGANLKGLDQILLSTAQQSFNVMLFGALVGAAIGFGIAHVANSRRSSHR